MVRCPFSTMCVICTVVSMVSVVVIVGLWTFQFLSFYNQTGSPTRADGHRLPECSNTISSSGRLGSHLHVTHVFPGNIRVMIECVKETDLILIQTDELKITDVKLTGTPAPLTTSIRTTNQTQYLALRENLKAGERYTLHIQYTGDLSRSQHTVQKVIILCCEPNKPVDHITGTITN